MALLLKYIHMAQFLISCPSEHTPLSLNLLTVVSNWMAEHQELPGLKQDCEVEKYPGRRQRETTSLTLQRKLYCCVHVVIRKQVQLKGIFTFIITERKQRSWWGLFPWSRKQGVLFSTCYEAYMVEVLNFALLLSFKKGNAVTSERRHITVCLAISSSKAVILGYLLWEPRLSQPRKETQNCQGCVCPSQPLEVFPYCWVENLLTWQR